MLQELSKFLSLFCIDCWRESDINPGSNLGHGKSINLLSFQSEVKGTVCTTGNYRFQINSNLEAIRVKKMSLSVYFLKIIAAIFWPTLATLQNVKATLLRCVLQIAWGGIGMKYQDLIMNCRKKGIILLKSCSERCEFITFNQLNEIV